MRPLAAVAVAAMLVLSGCASQAFAGTTETTRSTTPSNGTTASTTPTDAATATEDDGSRDTDGSPDGDDPPVNDTGTFRNLTALVDVAATKPATTAISAPDESGTPPTLLRLLGLDESEGPMAGETFGYAVSGDQIYVAYNAAPERAAERLLVHEQFHAIQFQQDWIDSRVRVTRDARVAYQGVVEGTAVWVTGEYVARYEGPDAPSGYERYRSHVEDGPDGNRLLSSPYLFGARWTEHYLEDPTNVSWAFENQPKTTEQLMHNLTAGEEPVLPVDLEVRSDAYYDRAGDRMGELYVWATLRGELSETRSRTAAAGWGGDELRTVADTTGTVESLVWAMRWDTDRDADEFAAAADAWATAREGDVSTRVVRLNATTTLVLAGDEAFVDETTASLDGTTVVVEDENETASSTNRTTPPASATRAVASG